MRSTLRLWIFAPVAAGITFSTVVNADVTLVSDQKNAIEIEATFSPPIVSVVESDGMEFARVSLDDGAISAEPGAPALPTLSRFIAIPDGTVATIEVIDASEQVISLPAHLEHAASVRRHCGPRIEKVNRNEAAFAEAMREPLVSLSDASFAGPVRVALLTIRPLQLRSSRDLTFHSNLKVRVSFQNTGSQQKAPVAKTASPDVIGRVVLNKAPLLSHKGKTTKHDLIIVHRDLAEALTPLVDFKRAQGRTVTVHTMANASRDSVQSIIRGAYGSSNDVPTHTLLVGSIDHIPSHWSRQFWSDYPYTLLDSGNYPDLSIARLPARNVEELKQHISKIIGRETSSRNNAAFLVTSGFETSWCQVNLQFMIDNIFSGSRLPLAITKKYASDGFRTDAVVSEYNQNPNVIVYDGHGDPTGMTEIPLLVRHLPSLNNDGFPIVMDIACNNANWGSAGSGSSNRNFAESIVHLNETGAAGILASSYYSGGHDLFRHIFRASVYDEQSGSDPFHEINELGSMVLYGKYKYLEQFNGSNSVLEDNRMFFWLGDPATTLFQN